MGHGTGSLVWRRPIVPYFWRKRRPATWELWIEFLLGAVCLLLAAALWPYPPVKRPATIIAAVCVVVALVNSIAALVSGSRGAQNNGPRHAVK